MCSLLSGQLPLYMYNSFIYHHLKVIIIALIFKHFLDGGGINFRTKDEVITIHIILINDFKPNTGKILSYMEVKFISPNWILVVTKYRGFLRRPMSM